MHRYFFYDPAEGLMFYATAAERDKHAAHALNAYRDAARTDGWSDNGNLLYCGIVTHHVREVLAHGTPDHVFQALPPLGNAEGIS